MRILQQLVPDHVAQGVILLIDGEDGSVRDFCVEFFDDSIKIEN